MSKPVLTGPPSDPLNSATGYLTPPPGMSQREALEEIAARALSSGHVVSSGAGAVSLGGSMSTMPSTGAPSRFSAGRGAPVARASTTGAQQRADFVGWKDENAEIQADVIVAWKRASITIGHDVVMLKGPIMGSGAPYAIGGEWETALCHGKANVHGNDLISPDCSCGFYGMKDEPSLLKEQGETGNCSMEVEFAGDVLGASKGYRASHQRIIAIYLDDTEVCSGALCKGTTTHLLLDPGDQRDWRPMCSHHAKRHPAVLDILSLADLTGYFGFEVMAAREGG